MRLAPSLVATLLLVGCSGKSKPAEKSTDETSTRGPVVIVRQPLISKGPLKAKAVVDELETQTDDLVECYRKGLTADPELAGSVLVTFEVNPDGSVESTRMAGSRLRDSATERCVVNEAAKLTFPANAEGETTALTVPFLLVEFDPNAPPLPVPPAAPASPGSPKASSPESAPTPPGRG